MKGLRGAPISEGIEELTEGIMGEGGVPFQ